MGNTKDTWMQAAATSAQGALGIGIQRIGAKYDRKQQLKTQEAMMGLQMKGEREMMAEQQRLALEMWEKTGVGGQMEQLKKAGLNPGLIYGMGGAGGATTGPGGSPAVSGGQAPYVDTTGMGIQLGIAAAQMGLIKAQTEKTKAEATKIEGVDTTKGAAEIENLAALTKNEQLKGTLMGIQARIDEARAKVAEGTVEELIFTATAIMTKTQEEAQQGKVKTFVDQATANTIVDTVKMQLATLIVQKGLMEAQTTTEKGKPAVQTAEIDLLYEQAQGIVRQGVQKWRSMEMEGREMGIKEEQELREELKASGLSNEYVDKVVDFIILRKVLGGDSGHKPVTGFGPKK